MKRRYVLAARCDERAAYLKRFKGSDADREKLLEYARTLRAEQDRIEAQKLEKARVGLG